MKSTSRRPDARALAALIGAGKSQLARRIYELNKIRR
jgi:sigma54-dependent transcription regulator